MGAVQIIILIVGAVLFTVSFLIPERKSDNRENAKKVLWMRKMFAQQKVRRILRELLMIICSILRKILV